MNRPWTACAAMLIALGGTLLVIGQTNEGRDTSSLTARRLRLGDESRVVFCGAPAVHEFALAGAEGPRNVSRLVLRANGALSADGEIGQPPRFNYDDSCGYDRSTGIRYPRFALEASKAEVRHPSLPSFYNFDAARDYAAAQAQTWREERRPLMLRTVDTSDCQPMLRLELRPAKSSLSFGLGEVGSRIGDVLRTVERYPLEHNVRITTLALQNRAGLWMERLEVADDWRLARVYSGVYERSAKVIGLEPSEYEELVERAIEKLPPPEKMESPRQFRPAPSRQRLLRMASNTLQTAADLLDSAALQLEQLSRSEIAEQPTEAQRR